MEVLTAATLLALVWKVAAVVKYASARDFRSAGTQAGIWVIAFVVFWVAAQADVSEGMHVWGAFPLGQLDMWSLVLGALSVGSGASVAYDFKRAVDRSDSAVEPRFGGDREGPRSLPTAAAPGRSSWSSWSTTSPTRVG